MSCNCNSRGESCITSVPIFANLTEDEMLDVATITTEKVFNKGDLIYSAGDQHRKLYVIHTGRAKITRLSDTGKEQVLRVMGPGDFFGELTLFSKEPLTTNALAMEQATMCMIDGERLNEIMLKYPMIAVKVMQELGQRLESAENLIEDITLHSVERRIAQTLLQYETDEIELNMSKGDLASQLGMAQETLSRKLSAFQEEGLILQKGRKTIIILDRDGLGEYTFE